MKYSYNTAENKQFLKKLREDLLRFGKHFPSEGGASYYLGDDGTPWKDRPRETWITCRMAHVNGSWFHQLDEKNQLLTTVWPGKSDLYHAFQATLIPYGDVDISVAAGI